LAHPTQTGGWSILYEVKLKAMATTTGTTVKRRKRRI